LFIILTTLVDGPSLIKKSKKTKKNKKGKKPKRTHKQKPNPNAIFMFDVIIEQPQADLRVKTANRKWKTVK
jgi:hypothetical protein